MSGFSEFLLNNMKSSLEPEDLKIFNRNSKQSIVKKNELSPIRAVLHVPSPNPRRLNYAQKLHQKENSRPDENDETSQDDSDGQYDEIRNSKFAMGPNDRMNSYSKYRIMSNRVKESVKKKSNKVNATI